MENHLVNALGFDFNFEHPYSHFRTIFPHMVKEGEARDSFSDLCLLRRPSYLYVPLVC